MGVSTSELVRVLASGQRDYPNVVPPVPELAASILGIIVEL